MAKIEILFIEKNRFTDNDGHEKIRWGKGSHALISWADPQEWACLAAKNITNKIRQKV